MSRYFTESCSFQYSRVSTADPYISSAGRNINKGTSLMDEDDEEVNSPLKNNSKNGNNSMVEMTKFSRSSNGSKY